MTGDGERRIHERINQLVREDLGPMRESLATMAASCVPCRAEVERHRVILEGNGTEGLKTQIAKLNFANVLRGNMAVAAISMGGGVIALLGQWIAKAVFGS